MSHRATTSSSQTGRGLFVDLSTGRVHAEPTQSYNERFLGGRGVGQWLAYQRTARGSAPLDSGTPLILSAGLLCGTLAPAAARLSVVSRNYATGGLGFSNAGGGFAPTLKYAGFDQVVVEGRAERPTVLCISDGQASLRPANDLWGATTWETDRALRQELGERVEVASIGPAGEKLVKAAAIIFGRSRAAAHCGLGAVMGSKNLKAVAVVGHGGIGVADAAAFSRLTLDLRKRIADSAVVRIHQEIGTLCYPESMSDLCMINVRNWSDDHLDGDRVAALLEGYFSRFERGKLGCYGCPIFCSHLFDTRSEDARGVLAEGFEANAPLMFGPAMGLESPTFVLRAHALCSQYGLDIDASGAVIALAFDCYERGLLSKKDTGGLALQWGNVEAAETLLQQLALREGFGDLLAEGSCEVARQIGGGAEKLVGHLKGHEHFEAMRAAPGWALGTAVALRGGGHLDGAPSIEFGEPWGPAACERWFGSASLANPQVYQGKARVVSYFEKLKAVTDSLGICYFTTQWYDPDLLAFEDMAKLIATATGRCIDPSELMELGDRIHNVGKAYNTLHARLARRDDSPAARFFDEPIRSGSRAGTVLDRRRWDQLLDEYYTEKGWDSATGQQLERRLCDLGLADVAGDLKTAGMLS